MSACRWKQNENVHFVSTDIWTKSSWEVWVVIWTKSSWEVFGNCWEEVIISLFSQSVSKARVLFSQPVSSIIKNTGCEKTCPTIFPTTSPKGCEQAVVRGMLSSIFKYMRSSLFYRVFIANVFPPESVVLSSFFDSVFLPPCLARFADLFSAV